MKKRGESRREKFIDQRSVFWFRNALFRYGLSITDVEIFGKVMSYPIDGEFIDHRRGFKRGEQNVTIVQIC